MQCLWKKDFRPSLPGLIEPYHCIGTTGGSRGNLGLPFAQRPKMACLHSPPPPSWNGRSVSIFYGFEWICRQFFIFFTTVRAWPKRLVSAFLRFRISKLSSELQNIAEIGYLRFKNRFKLTFMYKTYIFLYIKNVASVIFLCFLGDPLARDRCPLPPPKKNYAGSASGQKTELMVRVGRNQLSYGLNHLNHT